jgi:N-acyl-phosphatidylethanolamine-hydrolysing phospholipase D
MKPFHMNPGEAVQAHGEVGAKHSIATHHSYFRLADEGYEAPARLLADARAAAGIPPDDFRILDVGETVVLER